MSSGAGPAKPQSAARRLTPQQTQDLLEKLRTKSGQIKLQQSGQTKLLTIQNPQTGQKQIVAIPIQNVTSAASAPNLTVSPIKVVRQTVEAGESQLVQTSTAGQLLAHQQTRTIKIGSPRPGHSTGQLSLVKSGQAGATLVLNQAGTALTPHKSSMVVAAPSSSPSPAPALSSPSSRQQDAALISRSLKRADFDFDSFSDSKRRKSDKGGKGLRHFSMKVCEKVKAKGSTSYNEVADELVAELTDPRCVSPSDQQYDQKNIRRRVYDALNVLMAMNIISKEKKEIRWLGLPTNSVQEAYSLESEKSKRIDRIKDKTRQLQDLIIQQIAFKNLVERNKNEEKNKGAPPPNSAIQLPFIIVSTNKDTVIDCQIDSSKMEYVFDFNDRFEANDDMEVLRKLNMDLGLERGQVSETDLEKAKSMVPRALEPYVVQLATCGGKGSCFMPKVTEPNLHIEKDEPSSDGEGDDDPMID